MHSVLNILFIMQVKTVKYKKRIQAPAAKLRLNSNYASAAWNWKILLRAIFNKIYTFNKNKGKKVFTSAVTNSTKMKDHEGVFLLFFSFAALTQ